MCFVFCEKCILAERCSTFWAKTVQVPPDAPGCPYSTCMVSIQHMSGVHTAHVWCPHSTCLVSTQHMSGVHTAHVWCPHSTCMVSTQHIYGLSIQYVVAAKETKIHQFGHEWGRRASPRAHIQSGRSHEPQEHFKIPPRPPGYNFNIKIGPDTWKSKNQENYNILFGVARWGYCCPGVG